MKNSVRKHLFPVFFVSLVMFGCSSHGVHRESTFLCENVFTLRSDFDHRFPEQPNYMDSILKRGFYQTYYYTQDNGFNCHYYLEYSNGTIIDEWGMYICDGTFLYVSLPSVGIKRPRFALYHSPTIDFFIIDELREGDITYNLVYQAQYIITTKG